MAPTAAAPRVKIGVSERRSVTGKGSLTADITPEGEHHSREMLSPHVHRLKVTPSGATDATAVQMRFSASRLGPRRFLPALLGNRAESRLPTAIGLRRGDHSLRGASHPSPQRRPRGGDLGGFTTESARGTGGLSQDVGTRSCSWLCDPLWIAAQVQSTSDIPAGRLRLSTCVLSIGRPVSLPRSKRTQCTRYPQWALAPCITCEE